MRNQIFHSPGNEERELAKIPGDGDPPPPHWDHTPSAIPGLHYLNGKYCNLHADLVTFKN